MQNGRGATGPFVVPFVEVEESQVGTGPSNAVVNTEPNDDIRRVADFVLGPAPEYWSLSPVHWDLDHRKVDCHPLGRNGVLGMTPDETPSLRASNHCRGMSAVRICRGSFDRPFCNAQNFLMSTDIVGMRKGCETERTRRTNGRSCTYVGPLATEAEMDTMFTSLMLFSGEHARLNEGLGEEGIRREE